MSQNSYEPPQPFALSPTDASQLYAQLPWYRKSSYVSVITLVGLCCSPAILTVCIIVLTGDVYYEQADASGHLKKWGFANKIAAIAILGFQILFIAMNVIAALNAASAQ